MRSHPIGGPRTVGRGRTRSTTDLLEPRDYPERLPIGARRVRRGRAGCRLPGMRRRGRRQRRSTAAPTRSWSHEFVSAIVEDRPARIDAVQAARWTAPGICAHASALQDGARQVVPAFGEENAAGDSGETSG